MNRISSPQLVLAGVIIVFNVLGTMIAFKPQAYESDDEPANVQSVETLVSGHWYGISSSCRHEPFDERAQAFARKPGISPPIPECSERPGS